MQSLRSIIRVNECEIAVIAESCFHQHFVHCIDETFHGTLVGFLNFEIFGAVLPNWHPHHGQVR